MTNRIEATIYYLDGVVNRAIGRAAWIKAMQKPVPDSLFVSPNKPAWANTVNKTLDHQAPLYAALEFLAPAISRVLTPVLNHPEKYAKYPSVILFGIGLAATAVDIANLTGTVFLSQNIGNGIPLKLAINAGTHIALDLGGAAINKIRNSQPSGINLAV